MSALAVDRVESAEAFAALRDDWNDLLARSRSESVFLAWEWMHAWWRHFGGRRSLRILAARDGRRLVGVLPLALEPPVAPLGLRTLGFLGTERVSSEYLDLFASPDREREAADAILESLLGTTEEWDWLRMTDLLPDAAAGERFAAAPGCLVARAAGQRCPRLELPTSYEGYLASLSHKTRGMLRQLRRKLAARGATWETAIDEAGARKALAALYDLHARRWAARGLSGNFVDPRVRAFHEDLVGSWAGAGVVRLHTLRLDGRLLACLYALEWKGTLFYYQSGFDPVPPDPALKLAGYSPGFVLLGHVIEDAIARGLRAFDFLRGPETYKLRFGAEPRETWTLTLVPPGHARARGALACERAVRSAKGFVKRRILGRGEEVA